MRLTAPRARRLLEGAESTHVARVLMRLDAPARDRMLSQAGSAKAREMRELLRHRADSAAALMDSRVLHLGADLSAAEALERVRRERPRFTRDLIVVDGNGRVAGAISLQELAFADPSQALSELAGPIVTVPITETREQVAGLLESHRLTDLPVVDFDGRLAGAIRYEELVDVVREETSADLLTMVGAGKEERALSSVGLAVRKRVPWLQINLVTAFLAAAVVGLFEDTIAKYTALAVLLPVVAGQSGNTGAQALAVTMRGLALREIGLSHWRRVVRKEVGAGFLNGVIIALVTAGGVFVWSQSAGLALIIGSSMVLAMVAAGFAGAIIPIGLTAAGQDPAQSSSIVLTTVTDIVGFFAFLGIATIFASLI
jgi:magnesium transporter